jgi:hypothetical protein
MVPGEALKGCQAVLDQENPISKGRIHRLRHFFGQNNGRPAFQGLAHKTVSIKSFASQGHKTIPGLQFPAIGANLQPVLDQALVNDFEPAVVQASLLQRGHFNHSVNLRPKFATRSPL